MVKKNSIIFIYISFFLTTHLIIPIF